MGAQNICGKLTAHNPRKRLAILSAGQWWKEIDVILGGVTSHWMEIHPLIQVCIFLPKRHQCTACDTHNTHACIAQILPCNIQSLGPHPIPWTPFPLCSPSLLISVTIRIENYGMDGTARITDLLHAGQLLSQLSMTSPNASSMRRNLILRWDSFVRPSNISAKAPHYSSWVYLSSRKGPPPGILPEASDSLLQCNPTANINYKLIVVSPH